MKTKRTLSLALAMLLPAAALAAPSEGVMTYSGYLRTSSGTPETAPQSVTFTLYDAATGGNTVWTQTSNAQPDSAGWFSVVLGASPSAFPPGEFASQTWLGVKVGSEAEMVPRQKVGVAPAALLVEYAGITGCTAANQILQWSGTAWQCIATPTGGTGGGVTSVGGATGGFITASTASGAVSLSLTGCPSGNQILQWTGTAWQCVVTPSGGTGGFTPPACGSPNMVMQWSGAVWQCAADATGLAAVAVSAPLSGNGTAATPIGIAAASATSAGALSANDWNTFNGKQSRVTGACGANQKVLGVNADGTVTCGTDTNTTYTAGTGLGLAGTTFSVSYAGTGSATTAARSDHAHAIVQAVPLSDLVLDTGVSLDKALVGSGTWVVPKAVKVPANVPANGPRWTAIAGAVPMPVSGWPVLYVTVHNPAATAQTYSFAFSSSGIAAGQATPNSRWVLASVNATIQAGQTQRVSRTLDSTIAIDGCGTAGTCAATSAGDLIWFAFGANATDSPAYNVLGVQLVF